jgi:hypothetical protein
MTLSFTCFISLIVLGFSEALLHQYSEEHDIHPINRSQAAMMLVTEDILALNMDTCAVLQNQQRGQNPVK